MSKRLNLSDAQLEELRHMKCDLGMTITQMAGKLPYSKTFITRTLINNGWHKIEKPYRMYEIAGISSKISKKEIQQKFPSRLCNFCRTSFQPGSKYNFTCSNCKNSVYTPFRYMTYV